MHPQAHEECAPSSPPAAGLALIPHGSLPALTWRFSRCRDFRCANRLCPFAEGLSQPGHPGSAALTVWRLLGTVHAPTA